MQPLESDKRRLRLGDRPVPVRYLIPNVITLLALAAGVTSIRVGIEGKYDLAVALIVLAALLDGVDGRVARMLNAQSKFGAELDSLSDFVSFGVAPAMLIYFWGLTPLRGMGWIAALVFACAMSLRLARFNAAIGEDKPKWLSAFFTGVPAPAGAIAVMLPIYLEGAGFASPHEWPSLVVIYVLAVSAMLVSTVPTFSGKLLGEKIAGEYVAPALACAALAVALLLTYPYQTMATVTLAYCALIPFGVQRFRQRKQAYEATATAPPAPAPVVPKDDIGPGETRH
ncbi:MAG: CDP-diacylglycerol--serine O-phosphatidyltransferase [Proteobacteria bacterium]|nr:CDP-diacylglycerol--serine O-phosphatidyltransferase [Pseudomonadota bacterium]